jgi:hypothetical protein
MKEAVAFILDSSRSMSSHYGSMTRLESAKEALVTWISDLMIQSKQHETAIVVLKTITTDHHLDPDYFPNITVIPSNGVTRPTVSLLRDIERVPCTELSDDLRGDLMDGIGSGRRCNTAADTRKNVSEIDCYFD